MTLVLFAAICLLAWVDAAQAGFLLPILFAGAFWGTVAGAAVVFAVNVAVSFGISYVATSLLKKKPQQQSQASAGGVQLDLRVDADVPQSLLVGYASTAGSAVYFATYGANNTDLIEIVALADHPCAGLQAAFIEGLPATLRDSGTDRGLLVDGYSGEIDEIAAADFVEQLGGVRDGAIVAPALYDSALADGKIESYGNGLAIRFFDGSQTEADSFAVAHLGDRTNQPWTASHLGFGNTYVRQHSIYNQEKVPGRMRWRYVVKGIALYDPRKDSTVPGGSGAHRFDVLSTHEWTENLAVITYNIGRGIYVADENGDRQFFYGLEGTTADQFPLDVWFAAMNECDVDIDLGGGKSEKQFVAGGEIMLSTEPLETIKELLKGSGGRFVEIGGTFKLYIGAPGLPVFSFDDGAILASREDRFKPFLKMLDRVNYLTGKYTASSDGWLPKVAPPHDNADWRDEDGRRLPAELDAPMVQSGTQMQRLQLQMLNRSRRQRKHILPLPPAAMVIEPGDVFAWDSQRNGYIDKLFEADEVDYESNLITTVSATEVDPSDYDWNSGLAVAEPTGRLISTRPPAKVIGGFNAEGFIDSGDAGSRRAAIRLTWDDPVDADLIAVLWEIKRPSQPLDVFSGAFNDPTAEQFVVTAGIQSLTAYEVRARFQSFNGYATQWSLWIPVTTPDVSVEFAELAAEVQAQLTETINRINDKLDKYNQIIASAAAEADAASYINKYRLQIADSTNKEILRQETAVAVGAVSASITELTTVVADGDFAFAEYTIEVDARFDTAESNIATNATAISDANAAFASYQTTVTARFLTNESNISINAVALSNANSSFASLRENVTARLGALVTFTATVTINTTTDLITWAAHNLTAGSLVKFSTAGVLPTGLTAGVVYFVISSGLTTNDFKVALTSGGAAINLVDPQSGVHTAEKLPVVTINITTNLVTWIGHGLTSGREVVFGTTGALPTGLTAGVVYFVIAAGLTADVFALSATLGGAAIDFTGTQSGTHYANAYTKGSTQAAVDTNAVAIANSNLSLASLRTTLTARLGAISKTTSTVTMSISTDLITWVAHGLSAGMMVRFTTTGELPGGLVPNAICFVIASGLTANDFKVSNTSGGAAIDLIGTQSGVHTAEKLNTVTMSTSTDLVTWTAHDLAIGDEVVFGTTGVLLSPLVADTVYFVHATGFTANAFKVSTTEGGASLDLSGSQSGTHYANKLSTGSQQASIDQQSLVIADLEDGLSAIWSLKFDVDDRITGVWIEATAETTDFVIIADEFYIAHPDMLSGLVIPVFSIQTKDGAPRVVIDGTLWVGSANIGSAQITTAKIADANITTAKIADANITTAKIGDLQVNTLKMGDEAVTIPAVLTEHNTVTATGDYADLSKTISGHVANKPLLIHANVTCSFGYTSGFVTYFVYLKIVTPDGTTHTVAQIVGSNGDGGAGMSGAVLYTPPTTADFTVRAYLTWTYTGTGMQLNDRTMVLTTAKR